MKLLSRTLMSLDVQLPRIRQALTVRHFLADRGSAGDSDDKRSGGSVEPMDDFESRIFGGTSGNTPSTESFFQKLDSIQKATGKSAGGLFGMGNNNSHQFDRGFFESFDSLSDGMDGKLKKAATYFAYSNEIEKEDYMFRPDVSFPSDREMPGLKYSLKDLDLTKPGVPKTINRRREFQTTTEEALRRADFRNVRYLANFITAAGIIKKRKMTGISAKAQRKIAREIKTARAFGLMPFTTMGQWPFRFGVSMEDDDDRRRPVYYNRPVPETTAEAADEEEDPFLQA
ncbi:hypothetical protein H6P81_006253 [Aristolochia fimbriata]|uniref:Small ribosomal subunit protein bS18c n=1 Tax=Aristolochia fimbriata TaxID=158543 RepID=A0AAV7EXX7_ARIFI|nr:hypothetical protein H6P81_006253 [Aristolochia fimbriata]